MGRRRAKSDFSFGGERVSFVQTQLTHTWVIYHITVNFANGRWYACLYFIGTGVAPGALGNYVARTRSAGLAAGL